jgi:hypothetical protein
VGDATKVRRAKTAEWYLKFLGTEHMEDCLLEDNTPPLAQRFGVFLITTAKHSVSTANARLEELETMFFDALREGLVFTNPVKRIRLKDRAAESEEELAIHQPYTKEHVYACIDRGISEGRNPEMPIALLLSIDHGGRPGDIFGLARGMFHRDPIPRKNYMKYYARKPKKWHKVYPFEPTVFLIQEYLDFHLPDKSDDALFFPTFGTRTGPCVPDEEFNAGSASAQEYFGVYLDALKIRTLLTANLPGRAKYSHAGHCGRVTCITMCAEAGISESLTRARVLHSGREVRRGSDVHRIYQKHSPEAVQRATNEAFNDEGIVNITFEEFKQAITYATERLRSMRGKLDLHDGTTQCQRRNESGGKQAV